MDQNGSYGGGGGYYDTSLQQPSSSATLRRRQVNPTQSNYQTGGNSKSPRNVSTVKRLDFMFPKVDREYTVTTDSGGQNSVMAFVFIFVLIIAETYSWIQQNDSTNEHISVDTNLSQRMHVELNITFPGLACTDLHLDVMDVAGDSQFHLEDNMVKRRLNRRGKPMGKDEIAETNKHVALQKQKEKMLLEKLPENYCGPCFGAHAKDGDCCNTCDELIKAYDKKKWRTDQVILTSEQCVREGRTSSGQPKRMTRGQGCNLSGSLKLNRVAGNFHIAMGEGIERDGRHIHTFIPDDTPNFNASHIIHHLSFGAMDDGINNVVSDTKDLATLNGVTKIVTKQHGTTGLFQYFIKVVPTTYTHPKTKSKVSTNRYFFTERFRPLMKEYFAELDEEEEEEEELEEDDDDDDDVDDDDAFLADVLKDKSEEDKENTTLIESLKQERKLKKKEEKAAKKKEEKENKKKRHDTSKDLQRDEDNSKKAAVNAGHNDKEKQHNVRNSVLPGIFFIYEIYPFRVEIEKNEVPWTHLLIRVMATVGGVLTIMKWVDAYSYSREGNKNTRR